MLKWRQQRASGIASSKAPSVATNSSQGRDGSVWPQDNVAVYRIRNNVTKMQTDAQDSFVTLRPQVITFDRGTRVREIAQIIFQRCSVVEKCTHIYIYWSQNNVGHCHYEYVHLCFLFVFVLIANIDLSWRVLDVDDEMQQGWPFLFWITQTADEHVTVWVDTTGEATLIGRSQLIQPRTVHGADFSYWYTCCCLVPVALAR